MNILFVSAVFPFPLYSGGQIRVYNLLKRLSKDHAITLLTFIRNPEEIGYKKELSFCKKVETVYRGHAWQIPYIARAVLGTYPFLFATYKNQLMKECIVQEIQRSHYDLVHIEPSYVWPSIPPLSIPVVTAEHNIEYAVYEEYVRRFSVTAVRPALWLDVYKLRRWEQNVWKKSRHVIAVSKEDAHIIGETVGESHVSVIPNGVDLTAFPFKPGKGHSNPIFLFIGNFLWLQNRDALRFILEQIWPALKEKHPTAILRIVGKNLPSSLRALIKSNDTILLEHVGAIQDEFCNADILLAPIRVGGGTKFKILEAMASGVPVVSTPLGAIGLSVAHEKEMMIAEGVEETVLAAGKLLSSPELRHSIVRSARRHIERMYSWDVIAKKLKKVWQNSYEENH